MNGYKDFSNSFIQVFLTVDSMGLYWALISSLIILLCQSTIYVKVNSAFLSKSEINYRNFIYKSHSREWVSQNLAAKQINVGNYSNEKDQSVQSHTSDEPTGFENYNLSSLSIFSSYSWLWKLMFIQSALFILFTTNNLLIFYIAFESTLLPFYLWIAHAVVRDRKWHALAFLVFYTLVGSIGMLWSIYILYSIDHSGLISNYINLTSSLPSMFWRDNFYYLDTEYSSLKLAFLLFSISFIIKFPVFPFAGWLPEAHVEASTEASVLLAAVLLKVAPFGFYRIIYTIFPTWYMEYRFLFIGLSVISSFIYAISLYSQSDLKRIAAYGSIIHMSAMLCLFALCQLETLFLSFLMAIVHSFCAAGIFYMIGFGYDWDKHKNLHYIFSFIDLRPIYGFFGFLFFLIHLGYPIVGPYLSELALFKGIVEQHFYSLLFMVFLFVFSLTATTFHIMQIISFRVWRRSEIREIFDLVKYQVYILSVLLSTSILICSIPIVGLYFIEDSLEYMQSFITRIS